MKVAADFVNFQSCGGSTGFQAQMSLILRYFDINCSYPKLTFGRS